MPKITKTKSTTPTQLGSGRKKATQGKTPQEIETSAGKVSPFPVIDLPSGAIQMPSGKIWEGGPLTAKELRYEITTMIMQQFQDKPLKGTLWEDWRLQTETEWKAMIAKIDSLPSPAARPNGKLAEPPQRGAGKRKATDNKSSTNDELDGKSRKHPLTLEQMCKESAVNLSNAKKRGWRRVTTEEASQTVGFKADANGFVFPYHDASGKLTGFSRVRLDDYYATGFLKGVKRRGAKYLQEEDSGVQVEFDNTFEWDRDKIKIIAIAEGEKKAASVNDSDLRTRYGVHAVSIPGMNSWHLKGQRTLHPDIARLLSDDMLVLIMLDTDVKPDVLNKVRQQEALIALAAMSTGKKVDVKRIHIPKDDTGKGAIDSFLRDRGAEEAWKLIEKTAKEERHVTELASTTVWDEDEHVIVRIPTHDHPEAKSSKMQDWEMDHEMKRVDVGGNKPVAATKIWRESPDLRINISKRVYEPMSWEAWTRAEHNPLNKNGTMNVWWPSDAEPIEGDTEWFDLNLECITDNAAHRRWLEQWEAYKMRHLDEVMGYGLLIWSYQQGIGKTTYADVMARLVGEHNRRKVTMKLLNSDFTWWMKHKLLFTLNEVLDNPKREARWLMGILQEVIGEKGKVLIHPKNKEPYEVDNHGDWILCTNSPSALYVPPQSRRAYVIHGREERFLNDAEFKHRVEKPAKTKQSINALYHRLLYVTPMTGFNPSIPPTTADTRDYIESSRDDTAKWIDEMRADPERMLRLGNVAVLWAKCSVAHSDQLWDVYKHGKVTYTGQQAFAVLLGSRGVKHANSGVQVRLSVGKKRLFVIGKLDPKDNRPDKLRAIWEKFNAPKERKFSERKDD